MYIFLLLIRYDLPFILSISCKKWNSVSRGVIESKGGSDFRVPKRKFKAVIFTNGISIEIREILIDSGTTVLTNTSLITNLKEGHAVSIDGETGVITGLAVGVAGKRAIERMEKVQPLSFFSDLKIETNSFEE